MALAFSVSILAKNSIKNNAPPSPQRRTLKTVEAALKNEESTLGPTLSLGGDFLSLS